MSGIAVIETHVYGWNESMPKVLEVCIDSRTKKVGTARRLRNWPGKKNTAVAEITVQKKYADCVFGISCVIKDPLEYFVGVMEGCARDEVAS